MWSSQMTSYRFGFETTIQNFERQLGVCWVHAHEDTQHNKTSSHGCYVSPKSNRNPSINEFTNAVPALCHK